MKKLVSSSLPAIKESHVFFFVWECSLTRESPSKQSARWFHLTSQQPCWCTEQQRKKFDSIIMQKIGQNLLLSCASTWLSHHVIENHLLEHNICSPRPSDDVIRRATLKSGIRNPESQVIVHQLRAENLGKWLT